MFGNSTGIKISKQEARGMVRNDIRRCNGDVTNDVPPPGSRDNNDVLNGAPARFRVPSFFFQLVESSHRKKKKEPEIQSDQNSCASIHIQWIFGENVSTFSNTEIDSIAAGIFSTYADKS